LRYLLFLILSIFIVANDNDLDGVDDNFDKCPNTPFDALVDKDGCIKEYVSSSKYILQVGITNNTEDSTLDTNLYFAYIYKPLEFSISTTNYAMNLSNGIDVDDDMYISLGYYKDFKNLNTKLSFGTRVNTEDTYKIKDVANYFVSLDLNYDMDEYGIFGYYSYNFKNSDKNYHLISLGIGKDLTSNIYSSISYSCLHFPNTTHFKDVEDIHSLSLYSAYMITDDIYSSLNFTHNFESETKNSINLNIGVYIE